MKTRTTLTALALMAAVGLAAQPASSQANPQSANNQSQPASIQLKVGNAVMTVLPDRGARIVSLKYNDQEIISQSKAPEAFGSTFWTSPQKEWNWPPVKEFDKDPYTVQELPNAAGFVMTSNVSSRLNFRVRKTFTTDPADGAFVISYAIVNESDQPRRVAPWEITRVENKGGLIFFDAKPESITPAGLMNFQPADGILWYTPDEAPQNRKINADGRGWLSYTNDGLLMVKKFQDLKPGEPAPDEAEIQVYVNRGKTYIELESQGAYTTLAPHAELSWTVRWYLLPVGQAPTHAELMKTVSSVVN